MVVVPTPDFAAQTFDDPTAKTVGAGYDLLLTDGFEMVLSLSLS